MPFFSLGIDHSKTPVETREKFALDAACLKSALEASRQCPGLDELVILSTCNRVEFYGVTGPEGLADEALQTFMESALKRPFREFFEFAQMRRGKDAVRHIFRVASGLESLVVGENEILGQMREAFRASAEAGAVHSLLYRLMEKCLKIGKEVRTETRINEGAVSIPSVAVELAEKIFGRLRREKVMVLGVGDMGTQTLRNLRSSGAEIVFVVSRSADSGRAAADEFGASWLPMEDWETSLGKVDILITSTSSPQPVVSRSQVERVMKERRGRPLFCIDIAVPRDIDPAVQEIDDVYLYNIDDLRGVARS
ncbi:MAG: glutamyl-tRNA reductase, partial [Candidatus Omnitrophica bacterium]|nr:glutamyl-tRNA reductase [Candidatus Omnitrophota bacterium]